MKFHCVSGACFNNLIITIMFFIPLIYTCSGHANLLHGQKNQTGGNGAHVDCPRARRHFPASSRQRGAYETWGDSHLRTSSMITHKICGVFDSFYSSFRCFFTTILRLCAHGERLRARRLEAFILDRRISIVTQNVTTQATIRTLW